MQAELAQAEQINGVAQDAHRFLRGVKAHRVFRHHEIDHELSAPVIVASGGQLRIGRPVLLRGSDVPDQVNKRIQCQLLPVRLVDTECAR